eukprot:scaffold83546_cov69-Phaeocystis_antarctica.AAC.1
MIHSASLPTARTPSSKAASRVWNSGSEGTWLFAMCVWICWANRAHAMSAARLSQQTVYRPKSLRAMAGSSDSHDDRMTTSRNFREASEPRMRERTSAVT